MRKYKTVVAVAIVVLALTFSLGSWTVGQVSGDSDIDVPSVDFEELVFPEVSQVPQTDNVPMANGTTDVYSFVAQDLDTNATVIFLTNTSDELATVTLYIYYLEGNTLKVASASIELNPGVMYPVCSDEVVSTVGIWKYARYLELEPTFVYGKIILPPGVVAEGYVAWNGSDNTYDPGDHNDNIETVPIKFTYIGSIVP